MVGNNSCDIELETWQNAGHYQTRPVELVLLSFTPAFVNISTRQLISSCANAAQGESLARNTIRDVMIARLFFHCPPQLITCQRKYLFRPSRHTSG